jgi:hypothetical protein
MNLDLMTLSQQTYIDEGESKRAHEESIIPLIVSEGSRQRKQRCDFDDLASRPSDPESSSA